MTLSREMLSSDQVVVYDAVMSWMKDPNRRQWLSVGGLAGTGKTTLLSTLSTELERETSVAYTAYTGKATNTLKRKLAAVGARGESDTVHGLIYTPVIHTHSKEQARKALIAQYPHLSEERIEEILDDDEGIATKCPDGKDCKKIGAVVGWRKKGPVGAGLIVLDEASMIGSDMWDDLLGCGVPILAVGDHGQLPPVGSGMTNLMLNPDLKLEKIHRQAEGNPILKLAHYVRIGGMVRDFLKEHMSADDKRIVVTRSYEEVLERWREKKYQPLETATICYRNRTRIEYNDATRKFLGFSKGKSDALPKEGDAVICLKNEKDVGLFNGMRGVVAHVNTKDVMGGTFEAHVDFPDDGIPRQRLWLCSHQFGEEKTFKSPYEIPGKPRTWNEAGSLFDFGYAITCHKAQGSQFKEAAVVTEGGLDRNGEDFRRRWVYTAVTRPAETLYLVVP